MEVEELQGFQGLTAAMAAVDLAPRRTKRLVRKAVECAVCTEAFNKTSHERVKCKYCNYESCRACNTQYLETSGGEAKCMNCQKIWIREDIIDMFGKGFIERVYKPTRGKYLYDLAKLQIPDLQTIAALFRKNREREVEIIAEMTKTSEEITVVEARRGTVGCSWEEYYALRLKYNRFKNELEEIRELNTVTEQSIAHITFGKVSRVKRDTDYAVKKCDCNGMVMRKDMKCGNCQKQYCKECLEHRDEEHECNAETVATVRLLAQDTKPCPKCTCAITKIDGCDQMWCPECRTAFSWNTGKIENGVIHNPHYYQWMRNHGGQEELARQAREVQAAADGEDDERVECENIPNDQAGRIIRRMVGRVGRCFADMIAKADLDKIVNIGQFVLHIQEEEIPKFTNRITTNEKLDVPIIKFLLKDISEKALVSEILKKDKANGKSRDICTILQTFRLVCLNLCTQISIGLKTRNVDMIRLGLRQFDELIGFTNTGLIRVSEIYADAGPLKIALVAGAYIFNTAKFIDEEIVSFSRHTVY